jgi:hypothetical protein
MAMVIVAQFVVALGLCGVGLWGRRVTADGMRMIGSAEDRERRAQACRRGAIACLICGSLITVASAVTTAQILLDLRTG